MSIAENIRRLRESNHLTQGEFGKIAGVSGKAVSTWENGIKVPRMGALQKISDYFDIPKSAIIEDEMIQTEDFTKFGNIFPIHKKRFPLLGEIACGKPIYADEDRESYVEAGTEIRADFCLRVKGDSMINARITDGDIVFIRKQPMVENGEIAAVIINDEATLKRVYYYPDAEKLVLAAENPQYAPFVYIGEELYDIRILGKAVAFQSDVK